MFRLTSLSSQKKWRKLVMTLAWTLKRCLKIVNYAFTKCFIVIFYRKMFQKTIFFSYTEWNLTELTTWNQCGQYIIIISGFVNTCACIGFVVLWVVELIYWCGGKKEHFVWSIKQFFPSLPQPPPPPPLSTSNQCDKCPSSLRCGGSWLSCQVLPATRAISILELAATSESKLQDVSGTQPPLSNTVVNLEEESDGHSNKKELFWHQGNTKNK